MITNKNTFFYVLYIFFNLQTELKRNINIQKKKKKKINWIVKSKNEKQEPAITSKQIKFVRIIT